MLLATVLEGRLRSIISAVSHKFLLFLYYFHCFPVECNKWYRYADEAPACLDDALVENRWATEEELAELDEEGKKKLLITSLALKLNPEKHTALGLALREVLVVLFQPVMEVTLLRSLVQQTAFVEWLLFTMRWTTL